LPNNELVFGAPLFPKRLPEVLPNNPPAGLSPLAGLAPKRPLPDDPPPNKLPDGFASPPNKLPVGLASPPKRPPNDLLFA
tara:strand:- start:45 stop:284 length:240 start_codon:yes stop_codon:yes gene_type:complete